MKFNLQTGRPVCMMSFTLEGHGEHYVPSPSNAFLKKERPVCISFVLEGHGDHYVKLNCGIVLLLVVVLKYYTTEASEYYTKTYAAPSCITKESKYCITHPRQRQPAEGRGQFAFPSCSKVTEIITPIPDNVNLQKGGASLHSFMLEGHGDHYITMAFCCCWVSIVDVDQRENLNYAVVVVVSLMAGSATGVPMSHPHGWYQTATPMSYYTDQTYATTGYYTTKSPDNYTTATTLKSRSIIFLPRATLPKRLNTTPRLPSTSRNYSAPSYYTDSN
ncbi:hypothetical protein DAPPUDRAFT_269309 [Daphnia pulex]|uniref:Uncharacterized protein n=1 Tax=Daphnia pulex TaxID=6669 RepID=E9HZ61_DAPPU|nr:hypothetical protein DAPPUDRAFT_269309 [Daphnia pulex]|eukprot:EFX62969.1 hypothetical protein DAPPUDRAFT_269309 [Daphnia pulex]